MAWMNEITQALKRENLLDDPAKSPLIPVQRYCPTLLDGRDELCRLLAERKWTGRTLSVFTDGVSKKTSEGGQGDLDKAFRNLVNATGMTCEWIDLSRVLGIRPGELHASHVFVEKIRPLLKGRGNHISVTLGSGSITDLIKHALHLEGLTAPLITVPTALTVTAFTSSFAVLDFHGAKRTLVSRPVSATLWLAPFLQSAPARMSRAGYGDLLARFVAYGDWFLGHRLGVMDRYDEGPYRLMEPFAAAIKAHAGAFAVHPLPGDAADCTAAALGMAGIAMSVAGETTPLSGFEHVISHALDFLHLLSGRELVLHGEQVALGSVISARTIDWLLVQPALNIRTQEQTMTDQGLAILDRLMTEAPWGSLEEPAGPPQDIRDKLEAARYEFHGEYRKKSERWMKAAGEVATFKDQWTDIRHELARLTIRGEEMEQLAHQAGLPLHPGDTHPMTTDRELNWAIRFSPFIRSRMNIADLLFWMDKDASVILSPDGLS